MLVRIRTTVHVVTSALSSLCVSRLVEIDWRGVLWLQVAPCPDEWARSAMSALIRVGEPLDAITAREAATGTICRYLCILPPTDVPAVAKTIIHWIAQRASGSSRVANLLLLWRAVVDTDLSVWKRAQAGTTLNACSTCLCIALQLYFLLNCS